MNEKFVECFANPIKCRLLIEIHTQGQVTAKQLATTHDDIPQATLYRYLKKMTDDKIIKVIEEKQVRNVTEKVYTVAVNFQNDIKKMLAENLGEAYMLMFQQFTMGLLHEFQEYASKKDIDILNDGSGFSSAPFYATNEELKELTIKLNEVIIPYIENKPTPERKMRILARIITPPKTLK